MPHSNIRKSPEPLVLAANIVAAFVGNNRVEASELAALLNLVHDAVRALAHGRRVRQDGNVPAVDPSKSVTADYIICLEDGVKLQTMKRYLRTHYDLSPEDYRRRWSLPADYPMTAPNYSERRSALAKEFGLGTRQIGKRSSAGKRSRRRRSV